MTEHDSEPQPMQRNARRVFALLSLAALVSFGGLVVSLTKSAEGPSLSELGWRPYPSRQHPPEPLDPTPRLRLGFSESQRFGIVRTFHHEGENPRVLPLLTRDLCGQSNNTCVRIDGYDHIFGHESSGFSRWRFRGLPLGSKDARWGTQSCMAFKNDSIYVTQLVELVVGAESRLYDTVLVRYRVINRDTQGHSVGLRVLLDVRLGDNDGPPFYVPPVSAKGRWVSAHLVDGLEELNGDEIPPYITVVKPPCSVLANGELRDGTSSATIGLDEDESERLHKVVLCHWPGHSEIGWDWPYQSIRAGNPAAPDSCAVLYWPQFNLGPGDDYQIAFTYGLSRPLVDTTGKLPSQMQVFVEPERPKPREPFRIIACVQTRNRNEDVWLKLPPSLSLLKPKGNPTLPQTVPLPGPAGFSRVIWEVRGAQPGHYPLVVEGPGKVRRWVEIAE